MERQTILYVSTKRFQFLIPESVLIWMPGDAQMSLAQRAKIRTVATSRNVEMGVIPLHPPDWTWHSHGFTIFEGLYNQDEGLVQVETLAAAIHESDRKDDD